MASQPPRIETAVTASRRLKKRRFMEERVGSLVPSAAERVKHHFRPTQRYADGWKSKEPRAGGGAIRDNSMAEWIKTPPLTPLQAARSAGRSRLAGILLQNPLVSQMMRAPFPAVDVHCHGVAVALVKKFTNSLAFNFTTRLSRILSEPLPVAPSPKPRR